MASTLHLNDEPRQKHDICPKLDQSFRLFKLDQARQPFTINSGKSCSTLSHKPEPHTSCAALVPAFEAFAPDSCTENLDHVNW